MMIHSNIDPELPWGYWLRLDGAGSQTLTDDEGRKWPTIRDAFWQGRLGFKKVNERTGAPMLELLLAVLVSKSRRGSWDAEPQADLFSGNTLLEHHFNLWMVREGFLTPGDSDVWRGGDITAEGWSVMLMLGATRPQPVRAVRPTWVSVQELFRWASGRCRQWTACGRSKRLPLSGRPHSSGAPSARSLRSPWRSAMRRHRCR